jgi:hypothetical protein
MQLVPKQHPVQLVELQVPEHTPLWQLRPVPQAAQTAPPWPHSELLSLATATQVVPEQQPEQLLELQLAVVVQTPPVQACPAVQATQARPGKPLPHCELVSLATGTQLFPAQQPVQLIGEHCAPPVQVPPVQVCPAPHAMQVAPWVAVLPHWEVVSLATRTQVFPAQQPAQLDALQLVPPLHTPPEQVCPPPQATQAAPWAAVLPH